MNAHYVYEDDTVTENGMLMWCKRGHSGYLIFIKSL